jgi:hypothetical protein
MDRQEAAQGVAAGAIGFGVVGVLAPGALLKAYGADTSPTARAMTRLWGTRNLVLGVLTLQLDGNAQDTVLAAAMTLNLSDSLLGLLAPALDGLPARTSLAASLTSGAFAGLAGYARSLPA